jgi:hypothetical protein
MTKLAAKYERCEMQRTYVVLWVIEKGEVCLRLGEGADHPDLSVQVLNLAYLLSVISLKACSGYHKKLLLKIPSRDSNEKELRNSDRNKGVSAT